MDSATTIRIVSIIASALTVFLGAVIPSFSQGRAVVQALTSIAQQPDAANDIRNTLLIGLALVESTAIYAFVLALLILLGIGGGG
jgi:F-type H+-transporting ATPase subunit c